MWRPMNRAGRQRERERVDKQSEKKQGKKERIAGRLLILLVAGKKKHPAHAQTVNVTVTSKPKGRCVCVRFGKMGIRNVCVNSMPVERKAKTMFVQCVFV